MTRGALHADRPSRSKVVWQEFDRAETVSARSLAHGVPDCRNIKGRDCVDGAREEVIGER